MEAKRINSNKFVLEVSGDEFRMIVGALREICFAVPGFEFNSRLGFQPGEVKSVARDLGQQAEASGLEL